MNHTMGKQTMRTFAYVLASVVLAGFVTTQAQAKPAPSVDCSASRNNNIQAAVDAASPGDTIFISGACVEDVSITTDDITLSGNAAGAACNKADPGGTGTIEGTVTVDGVRATIEFLTITGSGDGVDIVNRANVRLTCNDISDNDGSGVAVVRSSNAVLRDNTVSGNGQLRFDEPFIFFDCGLFASDASSVDSRGNTYENNSFCAIDVVRQSSFRNGAFLPRDRDTAHPANLLEQDVFTEKNSAGAVAIDAFNGGIVDLRNAVVNGRIEVTTLSSLHVDGETHITGNINASNNSVVRIKNREGQLGDRQVTFSGLLFCDGSSVTSAFISVSCGQTCTGFIGGDSAPNTCTP